MTEPTLFDALPARPAWWTLEDEAAARSHEWMPDVPGAHAPPEPDAPEREWDAFNAASERWAELFYAHQDANEHRWTCRRCSSWESADGLAGRCLDAELREIGYDRTAARDNPGCISFYPRTKAA